MTLKNTATVKAHFLIEQLRNCQPGKTDAYAFEKICTECIEWLFHDDLGQFSAQHRTQGGVLRTDLVCVNRGVHECWKFLRDNYGRYVLFEFKNYAGALKPDVIFNSSKYFCEHAHRNVLIFVSRKGMTPQAHQASLRYIRSHQLMIDLNEKQIIQMLLLKANGKDPSDFLMKLIDEFMLSICA